MIWGKNETLSSIKCFLFIHSSPLSFSDFYSFFWFLLNYIDIEQNGEKNIKMSSNTNKNGNPEHNEINGNYVSGNELLLSSAVLLSEVTQQDTIETNIINSTNNDVSDDDDVSSSDSSGINSISQMVYKTSPAQRKKNNTKRQSLSVCCFFLPAFDEVFCILIILAPF